MANFTLDKTIRPIAPNTNKPSAGIGYVFIPKDVDRDLFVIDCLRTNTVTIYGGVHNGYFTNVAVDTEVIQRIKFPTKNEQHGSPVVWVNIPGFNKPVIVAILKYENDYYQIDEHSRNQTIEIDGKRIDISKRALEAIIDITVKGDTEHPGEININIQNEDDLAELNVYVHGKVNIHAKKEINLISDEIINLIVLDEDQKERVKITYEIEKGFFYKDEFGNEIKCVDGNVQIISKKIDHNDGKEPMVLGDTLQKKLEALIDAINKLTVPTAFGPSGTPINATEFSAIKAQLEQIKSKKSNLD